MCVFCSIVEGKIGSKKVLENDDFLAFEDIAPLAKIHIVIIPKKHIVSFDVMPSDLMGKMTEFIQDVALALSVRNSGYRIITNIGKDGGQEVLHLHFHLLAGERLGHIR